MESHKLLSLDVAKKYPGWSPKFIQGFSQDVLLCVSCAFVCQPKRKDKKMVKGMDQAVIMKLKSDLCLHHLYVQDPFTAKQICKLADIATAGDNLITVINLCATYDGYSCAFGGYSSPEKSNHESASEKVMRIIDEVGFDDSTFLFNNLRSFNCNIRPACLLTPPPLVKYANCPAITDLEGEVCATQHNIALLAFTSEGINCLLLLFAGRSCGIIKKVFDDI